MTEKKTVTVKIYNNEYTLKGEADALHIIELAKYVDNRMTEMGRKSSAPADKIAILVSMNIADELHLLEKLREESLQVIEGLEKKLEENNAASENAFKNAASLNEEADQVRIQLSREKEKLQAANELKIQAEHQAQELKKQVETLLNEVEKTKAGFSSSETITHQLQTALEEQKIKTQNVEGQYKDLKNLYESLDNELSTTKDTLEKAIGSGAAPEASHSGTAVSDSKLSSLIKKIETVLE